MVQKIANDNRMKEFEIEGKKVRGLVDTGADVSIMTRGKYDEFFQDRPLQKACIKLFGLGNVATEVLGNVTAKVEVDGSGI